MSLKELSKEQKQYVVLGILAIATLVILMVFGIRFSVSTISKAKAELDDLTTKIGSAEKALSRSQQTSKDYVETVGMLKVYLTNAVPERNCYSWATEVIYAKSRLANLEIDSIEELSASQLRKAAPKEGEKTISFESYSVRITAHGGYENTKYFLRLFQEDYPLVRFAGLEISAGKNPDAHDIQLYMQWPYNFGEVTNNWDAVVAKAVKTAAVSVGKEPSALKEPASAPAKAPAVSVTSSTKEKPVREPYPPTARPEVADVPASRTAVEPAAPKTQTRTYAAVEELESPVVDATAKPAAAEDDSQIHLADTDAATAEQVDADPQQAITESGNPAVAEEESQVDLADMDDLTAEQADAEPQQVITESGKPAAAEEESQVHSADMDDLTAEQADAELQQAISDPESVVETQPVSEPETVAVSAFDMDPIAGPEPVGVPQPQTESMADSDTPEDQNLLQMMSEFETPETTQVLEPSSNDVGTVDNVQINQALDDKDSTQERSLWGRLFGGGRKGENDEK